MSGLANPKTIARSSESVELLAQAALPDDLLAPRAVSDVLALPSFHSALKEVEHRAGQAFGRHRLAFQDSLIQRRLRQLVEVCRVNPLWEERIDAAVGRRPVETFEAFAALPITDKETARRFYTGRRPGLVVPIERNGFQVATSGGTASGSPSEIVYPLEELWDTYGWAGTFLGQHIIDPLMPRAGAKWVATTLSDHMMWSSSSMVGGVLQRIPGINFIGAGTIDREVFSRILSYPGGKAIMGTSRSIAELAGYAAYLTEDQRAGFRIALYGSGGLSSRAIARLQGAYPNLAILSFFAAMQAETIGLQLEPGSPLLTAIPGLHLIEVVSEDGRWVDIDEEGDLIVTRLFGNAAPVLRYRLGDRVIRRPDWDTDGLHAMQFEYVGRSSDQFALGSAQFFAPRVLTSVKKELRRANLADLDQIAEDVQFQIDHGNRRVRLLVVAEEEHASGRSLGTEAGSRALVAGFVGSKGPRNDGRSIEPALHREGYQFCIEQIPPASPDLHITEVGKLPLLVEIY